MNQISSITLKDHLPAIRAEVGLPDKVEALGNAELLHQKKLAFFCSVRCPGAVIVQAHDFVQSLCYNKITMIGGFHAPMEKEGLVILLRRKRNAIVCPARSLAQMRVSRDYQDSLRQSRLLFLSAFAGGQNRATAQLSYERNRLVAALANSILVAHAESGSKTFQLCREIIAWGKPLFTFADPANADLIALGAAAIDIQKMNVILNV